MKNGDIITKMNGKVVIDFRQIRLAVAQMPPGTSVTFDYFRDNKAGNATVKLGERPTQDLAGGENAANPSNEGVLNGVTVGDITAEIREQLQFPAELKGAVITDVDPDSASANAGLAKGDVVLDLNRKPVHDADEAVKLSSQLAGPKVLLRVWRQGAFQFIVVDEPKK
jgi:serine protease Do